MEGADNLDLYEKVNSIFATLSPSQKKVMLYLKNNWEQVCLMTAKELGGKVAVSEATVHRVAKQLGYSSFLNMKKDLRENYLNKRALAKFEMSGNRESSQLWLEEHFSDEIGIMDKTFQMNRVESFDKAAKIIFDAKHNWVLGGRMGLTLTESVRFIFNYMLGNCSRLNFSECSENIAHMTDKEVIIVSGFQRYSTITLKIVEQAKRKGVKIISITDCDLSPFVKFSDVAFYAATSSSSFLDSYTASLSPVNALTKRVISYNGEKIKDNVKNIEGMYKIFESTYKW